jgi:hypothetical protein
VKPWRVIRKRLCLEQLEDRLAPAVISTNWSGFAVETNPGGVTAVSGSWVVPTVTGTKSAYSSAWVGIDGSNSNSVEQIGTDSDIVGGQPVYYAWYEMYPNPSIDLSMRVQPGDAISASVRYNANSGFTLSITDTPKNGSPVETFSITKSALSARRSSAEWIQEAPSSNNGILPLANFGTVNFSNAQAAINGTTGPIDTAFGAHAQVESINMVARGGATQATTSGLKDSASGSSFSVAFTGVATPTPVSGGRHSGVGGRSTAVADAATTTFTDVVRLTTQAGQVPAVAGPALLSSVQPLAAALPFAPASPIAAISLAGTLSANVGGAGNLAVPDGGQDANEPPKEAAPVPQRPETIPAPAGEPSSSHDSDRTDTTALLSAAVLGKQASNLATEEGEPEASAFEPAVAVFLGLTLSGWQLAGQTPEERRRRLPLETPAARSNRRK